MKNTLLGAVALLALPLSMQAGELLPHTYARVYCASRAMGMNQTAATRQAVSESYISSGNPLPITVHGVETTTDVVAATRTARERCPQFH
tara:strand:+ start:98 stop:367 length:270 start_codon:yes stop_codon:yes gene_type:complete